MDRLAPAPQLRGREAEIAKLAAALDRAVSGQLTVVLIEGEAGIGKSRLLTQTLAAARERGMQIAASRAEELERTRPFGIVADALGCVRSSADPRRGAIAELLAAKAGADQRPITVTSDPGLRFRVVDAFTDLVEELALTGPLSIGLDDLHWADPASLLTLGALGRRLADLPVALIGCFRPAPRVTELDRLMTALDAAGARHLTVSPLPADAVAALAAEAVGSEPGPALLAGLSGAAGNPLFVTELLGALLEEGAIGTVSGQAEVAELTLPPTLPLTILRRLSFQSDDTLATLRAAVILGSGFSLTDLATVTGRPAADLSVALAEAITAQVIDADGAILRFRHDLIRESIYADLPASVRRGLHREAGQRLAGSGAPALQIAEHLARGAGPRDATAIEWLTRAAREAAARSPDVAADLLARAAGLMEPADPGRDRLLAERASSLLLAGQIGDAAAACRQLLDGGSDPQVEGMVRICLGHALLAAGRAGEALQELERAGESSSLTAADRASGLGWASFACIMLGDLGRAAAVAEQARLAAAAVGDHLTQSIALTSLAGAAEFSGHLAEGLTIINDAVQLADRSPGREGHRFQVHLPRAHILLELDQLDEARAALESARRISDEFGVRWHLPSYQAARGVERFIAGQWDDAIAELEASVALAEETGSKYSLMYALGVRSVISLHRGDLRGAEQAAAAGTQLSATGLRFRGQWAIWARALLLEAQGRATEALAALAGCWDQCAERGLTVEYPVLGADLVRLALAHGERGRALDVTAAVAQIAAENQVAALTGAALRCRGLTEDDPGLLLAAVQAYTGGHRPLALAQAAEDAGTAFARHGDVGRARTLLEQATRLYEGLDAARDLARAQARLREAGIRRGRRGTRKRPQIGWLSLTPTECAVVELVADGLSNPQIGERLFISRRTVQTHLAHVFAKLDISARAQLAAEVARHREGQEAPRAREDR